jgi:uncharacterized short protein YbdD (DUF466 family)
MAKLAKSFRLMVGVPDYENYLKHMQQHHPDLTPMDAKTFYRHCRCALSIIRREYEKMSLLEVI